MIDKEKSILLSIFAAIVIPVGLMAQNNSGSQVRYLLEHLGDSHWQYRYELANHSLSQPLTEVTIWFNASDYTNLVVTSENAPPGWLDDEALGSVVQPSPDTIPSWDGQYNIWTMDEGLHIGQMVKGFRISFDWLGSGIPGPQDYDVIDPISFETIESGITVPVPEPISILVWGTGSLGILRRKSLNSKS